MNKDLLIAGLFIGASLYAMATKESVMAGNPVPPSSVSKAAKRGLELRSQMPASRRGGTAVGIARARDLAARKNISPKTLKRMKSFFARHRVDKKGKGFYKGSEGYPSKGLQAWLLWGGDAGDKWIKSLGV